MLVEEVSVVAAVVVVVVAVVVGATTVVVDVAATANTKIIRHHMPQLIQIMDRAVCAPTHHSVMG